MCCAVYALPEVKWEMADVCSCITSHVDILKPPPELIEGFNAQDHWDAIGECSCFTYENEKLAKCKCCPCGFAKTCTWFPVLWDGLTTPCIPFGQSVTLMNGEEVKGEMCCNRCGFGKKGCRACLCLAPIINLGAIPPGIPVQFSFVAACLTVIQRSRLQEAYGIEPNLCFGPCCTCLCYPCALWRHIVFLTEANDHMMTKKATSASLSLTASRLGR